VKKPPTLEEERGKRRRELTIAASAMALMGLVFLAEYRLARSAESIPLGSHLLLFGLLSVATLLLILVIFFLIRNLFKLVFERRRMVLGSNLKTRLTLAFVALTLVPTILLFIASVGVVHTTIESWFGKEVEDSLQSSLVIAQAYYKGASENVINSGGRLASLIENRLLLDDARRDELLRTVDLWRAGEGLSSVQIVFPAEGESVATRDPALKAEAIPPPRDSFLRIALQGDKTSKIRQLETGAEIVRGIIPIRGKGSAQPAAALVADHYIPDSLARRLSEISSAYGDYQDARRMKGPVKTIYVLILLMVALLVIFIGFWFGVSMARDMTDPIQSVAEGAAKIAAGDLEVYIEPAVDDEIGQLVRSFNQMTADLRRGRDELVRVNLDLESRRKYMETVLKSVAAGVLALDSEGRITAVNHSAERLLGVRSAEVLGKPALEALPDQAASSVSEVLEELAADASDAIERQLSISVGGKALLLICFANSLKDEEGRELGFVLVFEDMTQLIKAQRMAAWRDVARRIAHEIKNPLTPIQLNAQRIRRKYMDRLKGDNSVLDQCTSTIVGQVEQLKNMVNEFSKFARMPAANPVPNDLNAVVREVVELYAQGNEHTAFIFRPDHAIPVFDLDSEQIKRAIVNLLDNASAAVTDKGKVTVATGYDASLSMVSVEVADNGPGLPPADMERLFEPYFSTKPGGTGLGLTIVSTIVADHNGFIRVKENKGGGARFIIELPVRRGPRRTYDASEKSMDGEAPRRRSGESESPS
jgi:two-component system nitrogen regulation sensor histidine kinase NtrY